MGSSFNAIQIRCVRALLLPVIIGRITVKETSRLELSLLPWPIRRLEECRLRPRLIVILAVGTRWRRSPL